MELDGLILEATCGAPVNIFFSGATSLYLFPLSHTVRAIGEKGTRRKLHMGETFLEIQFLLCIRQQQHCPHTREASGRASRDSFFVDWPAHTHYFVYTSLIPWLLGNFFLHSRHLMRNG